MPTIVISDGPAKKEARDALAAEGFGYIILPMDPLIGAKREFLDPAEMALFNSDALRVLAACGAIRLVQVELDRAMVGIAASEPKLPATRSCALRPGWLMRPERWRRRATLSPGIRMHGLGS
jgi:methylenetetrahydromethanopterin dehydrogenase